MVYTAAMLEVSASRSRQIALRQLLAGRLEVVVVGDSRHVQYLSSAQPRWLHLAGVLLDATGRTIAVWPNSPPGAIAADEIVCYEANRFSTLTSDHAQQIAERLADTLRPRGAIRIGIDRSAVTSALQLLLPDADFVSIDEDLLAMRRTKHADELALLRRALSACDAMFVRARQIIEPGVPELRVFNELHAAAVESLGETMFAPLGNDYACGVGGGPAREGRVAQAGEIYITDVGPSYRGYFGDASRALAVDRHPTDAQHLAWAAIAGVFPIVESMARVGVRCRDIVDAVNAHLLAHAGTELKHHLGHGIGLQPHEGPHLNPGWDDVLQAGDVFTVEPGLYGAVLRGGMRIENVYHLTESGLEKLIHAPLELV